MPFYFNQIVKTSCVYKTKNFSFYFSWAENQPGGAIKVTFSRSLSCSRVLGLGRVCDQQVASVAYEQEQNRSLSASAHCISVSELPRKTQYSQVLDETVLYLYTEERARSASGIEHDFPMASRSFLKADTGQLACTHPSSCAAKGPYPLPKGERFSSGVDQVPYNTILKQNKKVHFKSETGNNISRQGDKSSTHSKDCLLIRKCFSRPILMQPSGCQKTACRRLPFPKVWLFHKKQS